MNKIVLFQTVIQTRCGMIYLARQTIDSNKIERTDSNKIEWIDSNKIERIVRNNYIIEAKELDCAVLDSDLDQMWNDISCKVDNRQQEDKKDIDLRQQEEKNNRSQIARRQKGQIETII